MLSGTFAFANYVLPIQNICFLFTGESESEDEESTPNGKFCCCLF